MPTETNINSINLFQTQADYEDNKASLSNNDLVAIGDINMTGATADNAGSAGLVPAPAAGKQESFLRGDGTWATIDQGVMSASYTGSTQAVRQAKIDGYIGSYDSELPSEGTGNVSSTQYVLSTNTGMPAGTYTLKSLLQSLINLSHSHTIAKGTTYSNCNCNCDCDCYVGDGGCIVKGSVRIKGYNNPISIESLNAGDFILGTDGQYHKVLGLKISKLGKRRAVYFAGLGSAVFTDDHLFILQSGEYGTYDIDGYLRESSSNIIINDVIGTYRRLDNSIPIHDLSIETLPLTINLGHTNEYFYSTPLIIIQYPESTLTYTPIVEACEWILVSGIPAACARAV